MRTKSVCKNKYLNDNILTGFHYYAIRKFSAFEQTSDVVIDFKKGCKFLVVRIVENINEKNIDKYNIKNDSIYLLGYSETTKRDEKIFIKRKDFSQYLILRGIRDGL